MSDSAPPVEPQTTLDALFELLHARLAAPAALLTRETFAELLGIGTSTFDRLRSAGEIGPRPIKLAGWKWNRGEALAWLTHPDSRGELHDEKSWPAVWETIRRRSRE